MIQAFRDDATRDLFNGKDTKAARRACPRELWPTLATGVACATWALLEYLVRRKASVLGFCSGAVAGLVGLYQYLQ